MIREHAGSVTVDVLVQPRASRASVGPIHDGRLKISVTSPPVDGEANAAVVELFAKQLGVAKGAVEVIAGTSSRRKTLRITGVTAAAIEGLLG
ncbi:MAG: YggU family protein [Deltaproteobacteria bacterium]|nr:YggU family protein [Deltaproteobacteria bacterium]